MTSNLNRRLARLENANGRGRGWIIKIYTQEKDGSRTYIRKMEASAPRWTWNRVDMDFPTPLGWPALEFTEMDLRCC